MLKHLKSTNQSYIDHLIDSWYYSIYALKASAFFFCHGVYPDVFTSAGSHTLIELVRVINEKHLNMD